MMSKDWYPHFPCGGYPFIAERGEQGGIAPV